MLDGENKAEGFVKHFEYDMNFPSRLILPNFWTRMQIDLGYKNFGVLMHSGDLHSGHFLALIRPDWETRWLKFNDDRGTPVINKEVLEAAKRCQHYPRPFNTTKFAP